MEKETIPGEDKWFEHGWYPISPTKDFADAAKAQGGSVPYRLVLTFES